MNYLLTVSDLLIWFSYFVAPLLLFHVWYRKGHVRPCWATKKMLIWFSVFATCCGLVHLFELFTIGSWTWELTLLKAVAAVASIGLVLELGKNVAALATTPTKMEKVLAEQVQLRGTIAGMNRKMGVQI